MGVALKAISRQGRDFEANLLQHIRREVLLSPAERVLVAVSGGPDSTALIVSLSRLRTELGIELAVGHLDHRLRPESADEAVFVESLAKDLALPFFARVSDVAALAKSTHRSHEEAGRAARYDFLGQVASEKGYGLVATGHHRQDQAETVLLRLIRGSGGRGLKAMSNRSPFPRAGYEPIQLVRPLLHLPATTLAAYCDSEQTAYLSDPSNERLEYTRNRIRHGVMPLLREINPRADEALTRAAEALGRDDDYMQAAAEAAVHRVVASNEPESGVLRLEPSAFLVEHPAIQARVLRLLVGEQGGSLSASQTAQALAVIKSRKGRIDLPGGLAIEAAAGLLSIGTRRRRQRLKLPEVPLAIPGTTPVGPWRIEARLTQPGKAVGREPGEAALDLARLAKPLTIRSRRPGDRFQPLGMKNEKKLQDFLVDEKASSSQRDLVPLLITADGHIAWVAGYRIAEPYRVTENTTGVLALRLDRVD